MYAYDETAHTLFKRAKLSRIVTGIPLFDIPHGGLRNGDIVEIYGPTAIGKSELFYSVIVSCILPRKWCDQKIGGNEVSVILFDNDYHFCMPRFVAIIERRARDALGDNSTESDIQELLTASLARLIVFHCKDSLQFIVTLQSIPLLLENNPTIKMLMVDSISAFYWVHKHEDKTGTEHQKQIANQCRLLALNGLIVMATKAIFWKERKDNNNSDPQASILDPKNSHNEYLYNWGRIVKYRIVLANDGFDPHTATRLYAARLYFASATATSAAHTHPPALPMGNALLTKVTTPAPPIKVSTYSITDYGLSFLS